MYEFYASNKNKTIEKRENKSVSKNNAHGT